MLPDSNAVAGGVLPVVAAQARAEHPATMADTVAVWRNMLESFPSPGRTGGGVARLSHVAVSPDFHRSSADRPSKSPRMGPHEA